MTQASVLIMFTLLLRASADLTASMETRQVARPEIPRAEVESDRQVSEILFVFTAGNNAPLGIAQCHAGLTSPTGYFTLYKP
jgi:hypothetical protein